MPGPSTSPPIPQPPTQRLVGRSGTWPEAPFLFLNAMTKATEALPGVRCIFFVSLRCLYMLLSCGSNANTHGVSPT
jgi:hypothetical protein